ncbi:MAG TPA: cytochrome B [Thiolapillus brandeum]|uniref:Cytochrome B n=1 Tax=Thiolapillus brandeum TaxID=1076588 RepID=A0A831RVN7_9GAMM|nr:cytochrome B [Thiolapillus brandeum]
MQAHQVKVWDPFVRAFHWSLVVAFALAYVTEDNFLTIHVYSGYFIAGLIILRLLWGCFGGRYARFSSFVRPPSEVINYTRDILRFRARRYLGHNPAGGAMIIALLVSISLTLLFGLLTYGAGESSGPLAGMTAGLGKDTAHMFKEVHEFFANFTLALVVLHVFGVLLASFQHRENLVRSMITGTKPADENDPH